MKKKKTAGNYQSPAVFCSTKHPANRRFKAGTNFQIHKNFEKIYCKWIFFCIYLCFELRFMSLETLRLLIFPALFFVQIF